MITITHPTLYDISQSFHFFYVLVVSISCFHFVAFCIAISMLITLVITHITYHRRFHNLP
jgi:hypothetical protein